MATGKIVTATELAQVRDALEAGGRRLVLTNGCFDLLHAGHVRYLQGARAEGDALAVALNGDASVRALKGPGRPLNSLGDRAEILAALSCVDYVTTFESARATELLAAVRPHVYVKGGDYRLETLDPEERRALEAAGSRIVLEPMLPGRSTTALIAAMAGGKPLRLGVLGSGRGSNLGAILEAIRRGELNARVATVVSDVADAGILQLARDHGIPAIHLPPGRFRTKLEPEIEQGLVRILQEAGVELVVLAGYMRLVKSPLLDAFPRRVINIHPSLLPAFPGLSAWRQALDAGAPETGCTVHYVDHGIDTGEIIAQRRVPILESDTPEVLHARIQAAEHALYPEVIGRFVS